MNKQNMDSHNNEIEVEGGGKAFVFANMEDNEHEAGYIIVGNNGNGGNHGGDNILLATPRSP